MYCNPSADGLLEAAHDALSGSHLRLAPTAPFETASAEAPISGMPDFCCALGHDVRKLFRIRLVRNSEHVQHLLSAS
jgi:hypothetical protein